MALKLKKESRYLSQYLISTTIQRLGKTPRPLTLKGTNLPVVTVLQCHLSAVTESPNCLYCAVQPAYTDHLSITVRLLGLKRVYSVQFNLRM